MNKLITFVTFFILAFATAGAQSYNGPTTSELRAYSVTQDTKVPFRLFPTQNAWNFMKLDTRTGQMDGPVLGRKKHKRLHMDYRRYSS